MSVYRPGWWAGFREDYRFTGKEEDVQVGLEYFGKRYFAPALNRWGSADPLTIHTFGADLNLYAYVSGSPFRATDPVGLEPYAKGPDQSGGTGWIRDQGTGWIEGVDKNGQRFMVLGEPDSLGVSASGGVKSRVGASLQQQWEAAKAGVRNWSLAQAESIANFGLQAALSQFTGNVGVSLPETLQLSLTSLKAPEPTATSSTLADVQLRESYETAQTVLTLGTIVAGPEDIVAAGAERAATALEGASAALRAGESGARETKTLAQWLEGHPDLLEEARERFKANPKWQGIDPDSSPVFYRTESEVKAIRNKAGESPGHHPHGLALGGPPGQELTATGETGRTTPRNPLHTDASNFQSRILRAIKAQLKL